MNEQEKEKRRKCKHTRVAYFYPEKITCKLPNGKTVAHNTIKVVGCLNCNRVWMQDYGE